MNIKITDTKSTLAVKKKNKSNKSSKASGASFSSLVEAASSVESTKELQEATSILSVNSVYVEANDDEIPHDANGRGEYMLNKLEELERDILSGNPTKAIERLKAALDTEVIDRNDISPKLLEILDEIEMRVNIEIAKLESSK